jgi:hypothetical protein
MSSFSTENSGFSPYPKNGSGLGLPQTLSCASIFEVEKSLKFHGEVVQQKIFVFYIFRLCVIWEQ